MAHGYPARLEQDVQGNVHAGTCYAPGGIILAS